MQTLYANVVNLKVTPSEVVLEFANHFPDRPTPVPPTNPPQPDIRIVLSPTALDGLAQVFAQAVQQRRNQGNPTAPPAGPVN